MTPGSKTSEFALVVLLMIGAFVIVQTDGIDQAIQWAEALWKPVAAYAAARAAVKAAGQHEL